MLQFAYSLHNAGSIQARVYNRVFSKFRNSRRFRGLNTTYSRVVSKALPQGKRLTPTRAVPPVPRPSDATNTLQRDAKPSHTTKLHHQRPESTANPLNSRNSPRSTFALHFDLLLTPILLIPCHKPCIPVGVLLLKSQDKRVPLQILSLRHIASSHRQANLRELSPLRSCQGHVKVVSSHAAYPHIGTDNRRLRFSIDTP